MTREGGQCDCSQLSLNYHWQWCYFMFFVFHFCLFSRYGFGENHSRLPRRVPPLWIALHRIHIRAGCLLQLGQFGVFFCLRKTASSANCHTLLWTDRAEADLSLIWFGVKHISSKTASFKHAASVVFTASATTVSAVWPQLLPQWPLYWCFCMTQ